MAKFCPMCGEVTNCTENCKYCLEQEAKEREDENGQHTNNRL